MILEKISRQQKLQNILNHSSNAKSNWTLNITYIVSSIEMQFYQKLKHLFM